MAPERGITSGQVCWRMIRWSTRGFSVVDSDPMVDGAMADPWRKPGVPAAASPAPVKYVQNRAQVFSTVSIPFSAVYRSYRTKVLGEHGYLHDNDSSKRGLVPARLRFPPIHSPTITDPSIENLMVGITLTGISLTRILGTAFEAKHRQCGAGPLDKANQPLERGDVKLRFPDSLQ